MPFRRCSALAAATLALMVVAACGGNGFGREYEYDEQLYLNPDGSADLVINASIPALIALRGLALDPAPRARIDRDEVRGLVEEPLLDVTRVSRVWRRDGRQFIQIRASIEDVRRLDETKLFGWSDVTLEETGETSREYRQRIGAPSGTVPEAGFGWDGSELTAFKLHLPSRIHAHNVRDIDTNATGSVERGNILTWEQRLSDRLKGVPVEMHVTMERESILYRTLWLFGMSFGAAMALLAVIIWRIVRRGRKARA